MGEGFFREEALEHHTGARLSGDLLRVPPSWTRWTFAFLIVVFVAAAAYATLGSVTVYTHGLALLRAAPGDAPSVTVYFPERDRAALTEGLVIRIEDHRARLVSVAAEPVPLSVALAQLAIAAWPNAPPPSRLAVATVSFDGDPPAIARIEEVVAAHAPVGKESLLALLLPAVRSARED